jgi:hypothetical protein
MSIWSFQRLLSQRLITWNMANIAGGVLMSLSSSKRIRGIGSQFIGWALVNFAIAFFGQNAAETRERTLPDAHTPERQAREANALRRLLWINAGLDIAYMIGGRALMRRRSSGAWLRGAGVGIILQGLFLLIFDVMHAQHVPHEK